MKNLLLVLVCLMPGWAWGQFSSPVPLKNPKGIVDIEANNSTSVPYNQLHSRFADMNNDGRADLVTLNHFRNGIVIYWNLPGVEFRDSSTTVTTADTLGIMEFEIIRWNNDPYPDVLVMYDFFSPISGSDVFVNSSTGFRKNNYPFLLAIPYPFFIKYQIVDYNKDGDDEIIISSSEHYSSRIYMGILDFQDDSSMKYKSLVTLKKPENIDANVRFYFGNLDQDSTLELAVRSVYGQASPQIVRDSLYVYDHVDTTYILSQLITREYTSWPDIVSAGGDNLFLEDIDGDTIPDIVTGDKIYYPGALCNYKQVYFQQHTAFYGTCEY